MKIINLMTFSIEFRASVGHSMKTIVCATDIEDAVVTFYRDHKTGYEKTIAHIQHKAAYKKPLIEHVKMLTFSTSMSDKALKKLTNAQ